MQNKKGFTLIELMIVVAIVAILAMIAVPMYQRYIERSRNTASQNMLQQVSLAEIASQIDAVGNTTTGTTSVVGYIFVTAIGQTADVQTLMGFGFRPDPNVGFRIDPPTVGDGFVAFACHIARNSQMYVYDNISGGGVQQYSPGVSYGGVAGSASLFVFKMASGKSVAQLDSTGHKTLTVETTTGKSTGTLS